MTVTVLPQKYGVGLPLLAIVLFFGHKATGADEHGLPEYQ